MSSPTPHPARLGRILAVCLAALCTWLLAADAAGAYEVRVEAVSADGSQTLDAVDLDLAALRGSEDVNRQYTVRYGSGMVETEQVTGFSLLEILDRAEAAQLDIDPQDFRLVTITSQGGTHTVLESKAAGNANGEPVFFEDTGETAFLRPVEGADDNNGEDRLIAPKLLLEVRPRSDSGLTQAEVDIAASVLRSGKQVTLDTSDPPVEVQEGERVTFTGSVEGGPGGSLDYSWTFDDDRSGDTGQRVTHTFADPGRYGVILQVTDSDGDIFNDGIEFQVGEPKGGGPDRNGGGSDEDGSLDAGTSEPADSGTGGYDTGTTGGYDYGTTGDYDYGASPSPLPTPAPATPVDPKPPRDEATETLDPAGEKVSGELLGAATPVTPPEEEATADPPALASGTAEDDGVGVPGAAVAGIAVLSLLGVGALGELGRLRRPNLGMLRLRELLGR